MRNRRKNVPHINNFEFPNYRMGNHRRVNGQSLTALLLSFGTAKMERAMNSKATAFAIVVASFGLLTMQAAFGEPFRYYGPDALKKLCLNKTNNGTFLPRRSHLSMSV